MMFSELRVRHFLRFFPRSTNDACDVSHVLRLRVRATRICSMSNLHLEVCVSNLY
jgi:hypothetical protein